MIRKIILYHFPYTLFYKKYNNIKTQRLDNPIIYRHA